MVTERLQRVFDILKDLPPDEQDRLAAALQRLLEQPSVTSDVVRPEVMAAFDEVMKGSTAVLDYLRDNGDAWRMRAMRGVSARPHA